MIYSAPKYFLKNFIKSVDRLHQPMVHYTCPMGSGRILYFGFLERTGKKGMVLRTLLDSMNRLDRVEICHITKRDGDLQILTPITEVENVHGWSSSKVIKIYPRVNKNGLPYLQIYI